MRNRMETHSLSSGSGFTETGTIRVRKGEQKPHTVETTIFTVSVEYPYRDYSYYEVNKFLKYICSGGDWEYIIDENNPQYKVFSLFGEHRPVCLSDRPELLKVIEATVASNAKLKHHPRTKR